MKLTLIYLLSHGHTARGALQTRILEKLVDKGFNVVCIGKHQLSGDVMQRINQQGAEFEIFNPEINALFEQTNVFRQYVHQNIFKNPALLDKHRQRLRSQKSSLKKRLVSTGYFYLGALLRHILLLKKFYMKWENSVFINEKADYLLKTYNAAAVISTRPVDPAEAIILNSARRNGITRIMYILSWDNITSKGIFPELADYYLTWGDIMNEELVEYYDVPRDRLFLTGVTHFDVHAYVKASVGFQEKYLRDLGLRIDHPYILFTMSSVHIVPYELDIIEWLANEIANDAFGERLQMIVRPHMVNFAESKSDVSWKDRLMSLRNDRVAVDFPDVDNTLLEWYSSKEDMLKLSSLIKGAFICINSGSTIAIEAVFFDKPVILTLFDLRVVPDWCSAKRIECYIHIKKLIESGACQVARSLDEFDRELKAALANPGSRTQERQSAVQSFCYKADGLSTDRLITHISDIVLESSCGAAVPNLSQ